MAKECRFKVGDWVQVEDKPLGLKAVGTVVAIVVDINKNLFYSIDWRITECKKTQGIQPTSLYPLDAFDKKGSLAPSAQVLYGSNR